MSSPRHTRFNIIDIYCHVTDKLFPMYGSFHGVEANTLGARDSKVTFAS